VAITSTASFAQGVVEAVGSASLGIGSSILRGKIVCRRILLRLIDRSRSNIRSSNLLCSAAEAILVLRTSRDPSASIQLLGSSTLT
jgi:hypothetical protein